MNRVDMKEIQSQNGVPLKAEIYMRSMLSSNAGLPCWDPRPYGRVGDRGIMPGDVGTFDLGNGFDKIFNIWEDDFAYQPPRWEWTTRPLFSAGDTIVSDGISADAHWSEDGRCAFQLYIHCRR